MGVQISLCQGMEYSRYRPRSEIARLYGSYTFNFGGNHQIDFWNDYINYILTNSE